MESRDFVNCVFCGLQKLHEINVLPAQPSNLYHINDIKFIHSNDSYITVIMIISFLFCFEKGKIIKHGNTKKHSFKARACKPGLHASAVCVCVYMCICMCVHFYVWVYVYMFTYLCVCVYINRYIWIIKHASFLHYVSKSYFLSIVSFTLILLFSDIIFTITPFSALWSLCIIYCRAVFYLFCTYSAP